MPFPTAPATAGNQVYQDPGYGRSSRPGQGRRAVPTSRLAEPGPNAAPVAQSHPCPFLGWSPAGVTGSRPSFAPGPFPALPCLSLPFPARLRRRELPPARRSFPLPRGGRASRAGTGHTAGLPERAGAGGSEGRGAGRSHRAGAAPGWLPEEARLCGGGREPGALLSAERSGDSPFLLHLRLSLTWAPLPLGAGVCVLPPRPLHAAPGAPQPRGYAGCVGIY